MKERYYKHYLMNMMPCVGHGILTGTLTGATIFLFKFLAGQAEELSRHLYGRAGKSLPTVLLAFVVLVALALVMSRLHKAIPECKGGGIPRSEGILRGILPFRWFRTLWGTLAGSTMSFLAGLPCGSEGPSVLIGTSLGCMTSKASKKQVAWSRYAMTGGASAGFAVATGAPLSGILFALEEIHKRYSPLLLLTVSTAVFSATAVNQLLCDTFHLNPALFTLPPLPAFKPSCLGFLLTMGVLVFLAVAAFDESILLFRRFTSHFQKKGTTLIKLVSTFLLAGILGFVLSDADYSGHHLIVRIMEHDMTFTLLFALFVVRLLMMLLVTDSGTTGGIFIPTLALGALTAAMITKLLLLSGMPAELSSTMIFLGMCAFIGGTLRAPLTATMLFTELSGQFVGMFYVAVVVFVVYLLTEALNQTPFYDKALEEMDEVQHHGQEMTVSSFHLIVSNNAFVTGKAVRDVLWPHTSVITDITCGPTHRMEMDDGEHRLLSGDEITIRAGYYDKEEILALLRGLVGTEHEIIVV